MRARDFVQEYKTVSFQGLDISMEREDDEIMVTASAGGKKMGHVMFVDSDGYLMPQDLEVDERYRGQGIARTMYDYVKSQGYKIRRSGQQTDAGAGFWGKHRPGENVWEQGVPAGDKMSRIDLGSALANTSPEWQKFVNSLPPQLAREFVDERPRPDQDDIDFLTPLRLVSPQPVSVQTICP
jgi:GNAT superfamily N-acetyltransferase